MLTSLSDAAAAAAQAQIVSSDTLSICTGHLLRRRHSLKPDSWFNFKKSVEDSSRQQRDDFLRCDPLCIDWQGNVIIHPVGKKCSPATEQQHIDIPSKQIKLNI